jgi:hypothetical protein
MEGALGMSWAVTAVRVLKRAMSAKVSRMIVVGAGQGERASDI